MGPSELAKYATESRVPLELVKETAESGRLPGIKFLKTQQKIQLCLVPNFAAGGVATPADASLLMQLGAEAIFVGSGIFMSSNPAERAAAIVKATTHYKDAKVLAEVSRNLGTGMVGLDNKRESVSLEKNA